jgi:hypothetical protein
MRSLGTLTRRIACVGAPNTHTHTMQARAASTSRRLYQRIPSRCRLLATSADALPQPPREPQMEGPHVYARFKRLALVIAYEGTRYHGIQYTGKGVSSEARRKEPRFPPRTVDVAPTADIVELFSCC